MNDDPSLWSQVFSERNAVLAVLGGIGGLTRSLALKTSWQEGLRVAVIGAIVAGLTGSIAPVLLKPWIGDLPEDVLGAFGVVAALAFVTGLVAVTLIERLIGGDKQTGDGDEA